MATDIEKLIVALEARTKAFENALAKANGTADRRARAIESRFAKMNKNISASFAGLSGKLGGSAAGILGAAFSVSAVRSMIDSSIKIQNALKVTGLSGKELSDVYEQLFASAQKNAAPLEALVTLYSRVSSASKELNASQQDMLKFTDGIGLALRVSGQSAEESAGALLQLSQALGGGVIQAEEYNSLLDGGRPILQAVAAGLKEAGGSVSKLTSLVKTGKVSSEAFFRAFLAGAPSLERAVSSSESTVSSSLVRLQNSLIDAAGKFNESSKASEYFGKIATEVATEVNNINFDNLIKQIEAVIEAINRGAGAVGSWLDSIGKMTGLQGAANKLVGMLPGDTTVKDPFAGTALEGSLVITPQDAVQSRIDDAFNLPGNGNSKLTPDMIRKFASGSSTAASPKTTRLPASDAIKPVSLSDYKLPSSSSKSSRGGASKTDDYQREVSQIKERTAALQAETAAQSQVDPLIDDYGYALEKARSQQELMTAAQKAGIKITPELQANIEKLADGYARASAESEKLQEKQDDIRRAAEAWRDTEKDVTKGFIQDLREGVKVSEALGNALNRVADHLIDMGVDALFSKSSGSGLFGGLFSILGLKDGGGPIRRAGGGIVRGPGTSRSDSIPMLASDGEFMVNAKSTRENLPLLQAINSGRILRRAAGGIIGSSAPAIPSASARRTSNDVVRLVLQDDSGRMADIADQRIQTASGAIIEVSTRQSVKAVSQNIGKINARAQRTGK